MAGISWSLSPGESWALLGRNGSGKTTLLRILAGVLLPSRGEVSVTARRRVYVTAGERQFHERLTGYENLRFLARLSGVDLREIRPACAVMGLSEETVDQPVWTYTTGMKLRLAVARAFMGDADLVLLDEPARSIDSEGRGALMRALERLRAERGAAIVLAGHDPDTARACGQALVLEQGSVAWSGPAAGIPPIPSRPAETPSP